jgi:hypothetical protein
MGRGKIPATAAVWLANQLSREETVMEEQQERDRRKRAEEEAEVEAHRRKLNEDERDEGKSDDTPDVEAHAKARRP